MKKKWKILSLIGYAICMTFIAGTAWSPNAGLSTLAVLLPTLIPYTMLCYKWLLLDE